MSKRLIAIVGAMASAALGTWLTARSRRRATPDEADEEFGELSGLPALSQFAHINIDDDRAAEIIKEYAPALEEVARAEG